MTTFTEMLKTVLAKLGYDDDEAAARYVLRRCDELGCAIEDLPAKLAEHNAEMERVVAKDAERLGHMIDMAGSGATPMLRTESLDVLRTIASLDAKLSRLEADEKSYEQTDCD